MLAPRFFCSGPQNEFLRLTVVFVCHTGVSDWITWHGLTPDFTLNKTQEIYKAYHTKTFVDIGVAGFKLDECDGNPGKMDPGSGQKSESRLQQAHHQLVRKSSVLPPQAFTTDVSDCPFYLQ